MTLLDIIMCRLRLRVTVQIKSMDGISFEKLINLQVAKEFDAFYGSSRFRPRHPILYL